MRNCNAFDRRCRLTSSRPFGLILPTLTLARSTFISVWIGYHYLIDGVFSIVAVFAAHLVLKRSVAASRSDAALAPVAAE